jgi:hypothetical protein
MGNSTHAKPALRVAPGTLRLVRAGHCAFNRSMNVMTRGPLPPRLAILVTCIGLAGGPGAAMAQIWFGQASDGSVVLSDSRSEATPVELIGAAATVSPLPETAASAATRATSAAAALRPPPMPPHYQDLIHAAARAHGVPAPLVAAVAAAESGFDAGARSAKGAGGLMQLMPQTARRFKVADRYSPAQSLRGGAAYLRWLSDRYGDDLTRVLAAYNAGEQAVDRAAGVPAYTETQAYVPRVLAYLRHYSTALAKPGEYPPLARGAVSPPSPK